MSSPAELKFLIVDDHAPMRQTLRAMLSPISREIHEASEGGEAITQFSEQQPDWVIMDLQMKPINGLVATREICRQSPAARIVMVTQHDDDDLFAQATAAGACACFLKEDLGAMVRFLADSPRSIP